MFFKPFTNYKKLLANRMTESVCGAITVCARVCSRVLLDWRFFSVPFLAFLFVAHSVATSLCEGTCLCLACLILNNLLFVFCFVFKD